MSSIRTMLLLMVNLPMVARAVAAPMVARMVAAPMVARIRYVTFIMYLLGKNLPARVCNYSKTCVIFTNNGNRFNCLTSER